MGSDPVRVRVEQTRCHLEPGGGVRVTVQERHSWVEGVSRGWKPPATEQESSLRYADSYAIRKGSLNEVGREVGRETGREVGREVLRANDIERELRAVREGGCDSVPEPPSHDAEPIHERESSEPSLDPSLDPSCELRRDSCRCREDDSAAAECASGVVGGCAGRGCRDEGGDAAACHSFPHTPRPSSTSPSCVCPCARRSGPSGPYRPPTICVVGVKVVVLALAAVDAAMLCVAWAA